MAQIALFYTQKFLVVRYVNTGHTRGNTEELYNNSSAQVTLPRSMRRIYKNFLGE